MLSIFSIKRLESVWTFFFSWKSNSKRILLILKRNICQIFISKKLREKKKTPGYEVLLGWGKTKASFPLHNFIIYLSGIIIIICEKRSQRNHRYLFFFSIWGKSSRRVRFRLVNFLPPGGGPRGSNRCRIFAARPLERAQFAQSSLFDCVITMHKFRLLARM